MENILTKAKNGVVRVARKVATEIKTTPEKIAIGVSIAKNNARGRQADADRAVIQEGRKVKDIPFKDPMDPDATPTTIADQSNPNFRKKVDYERVMRTVTSPKVSKMPKDYSPRITKSK